MKFANLDIDGMLYAFGVQCYISGEELVGIYDKEYFYDLDHKQVRHTLYIGSKDLIQSYYDIGSEVIIPEENFTGTVKDFEIETSGYVFLELRK